MVFSSVPLYLDSPNWQQHPNQQVLQDSSASGRNNNHDQTQHLMHQPPPLPQPPGQSPLGMGGGGGVGGGPGGPPIRPNSMAERARLAKIPPPETPLKCPRCESTNTKFCYFNNYNLSQPRHFCKTCRRYWTRGGALRNVPVGGGCRRNKRSSSKSSSGGGGGGGSSSSKSSLTSPSALVGGDRLPLHMDLVTTSALIPTIPGLPSPGGGGMSSFMASLQSMSQLGMGNLGLSFGGALNTPHHPLGGLGVLTSGTHGGGGSGGGDHLGYPHLNPSSTNPQVQFPNMWGGFEIPGSSNSAVGAGLYTSNFQSDHGVGVDKSDDQEHENNGLPKNGSSDMNSQIAPIKTEDDGQGLSNIHKQLMNMPSSDNNNNASGNQFWAGGNIGNNTTGVTSMWTDLSGLNSSSTGHLL